MSLQLALEAFDGLRVAPLRELLDGGIGDDEIADLVAAVGDHDNAVGATWLVKTLLERNEAGRLPMYEIFQALALDLPWAAYLHLLQSVQFAPDAALPMDRAIGNLWGSKQTFVRVWAMDAAVHLGTVDVNLREPLSMSVITALNDPSKAMQARAKKLLSSVGWLTN